MKTTAEIIANARAACANGRGLYHQDVTLEVVGFLAQQIRSGLSAKATPEQSRLDFLTTAVGLEVLETLAENADGVDLVTLDTLVATRAESWRESADEAAVLWAAEERRVRS